MKKRLKAGLWVFNIVVCLWILVAFAVPAVTQRKHRLRFEPSTVVTVSGTIRSIEQRECPLVEREDSSVKVGTHVMLRTGYGLLQVHFGPASFLRKHGFTVAPGDVIEVTGSKFAGELPVTLIASEVRKGKAFLELRDRAGRPLWLDEHGNSISEERR